MYLRQRALKEYAQREDTEVVRSALSFPAFISLVRPKYIWAWHNRCIATVLERFAKQEITRLILCMPPRMGKSELFSRLLPAYIFGEVDINAKIIGTAYSHSLATSFNRDIQRLMQTPEYKQQYPSVRLQERRSGSDEMYLKNSELFEIVGAEGYYLSVGRGGSATGRGATHILIDDPIKNRKEADSLKIQQEIREWYSNVLYQRQDTAHSAIGMCLTRWNSNDLVRYVQDIAKESGEVWETIFLPQIMEPQYPRYKEDKRQNEELLWPEKFPSTYVKKQQKTLGSDFLALHQQIPLDQAHFTTDTTKIPILDVPVGSGIWYWDKAYSEGTGAYTSGALVGFDERLDTFVVYAIHRKQLEDPNPFIKQVLDSYPPVPVYVEQEPGAGKWSAKMTIKALAGYEVYSDIPDRSKDARWSVVKSQINIGRVALAKGDWNSAFLEEMQTFRHRDQMDAVSGAFLKLQLYQEKALEEVISLAHYQEISPL